jgi:putative protein-disulfide isomerase
MENFNPPIQIIYVMDPHCGWCYGFGSVILKVFDYYKDNPSVEFDILPGGLFPNSFTIPAGFAANKRPIAERITQFSGVAFSEEYFTSILAEGSFLDSELPSRAILAFKKLNFKEVVHFSERLLEIEFKEAKNNSKETTILEVVREFDVDEEMFKAQFESETLKLEVLKNFQIVQEMHVGFPTVLLHKAGNISKIASGYAPFERLIRKIEES